MEKNQFSQQFAIILITESSRHSFCRWQTFREALFDSKMIQTYPKTYLIDDF